jgi:hypothetical protein
MVQETIIADEATVEEGQFLNIDDIPLDQEYISAPK